MINDADLNVDNLILMYDINRFIYVKESLFFYKCMIYYTASMARVALWILYKNIKKTSINIKI